MSVNVSKSGDTISTWDKTFKKRGGVALSRNKKNLTLNLKMKKCAERLTSPDFDGNISKLCEELNIARSTFYRWYDKKEFKDYIKLLIDRYTESELFNVWKAIIETAKKGNPQALKLFFELKNLYKKNVSVEGGVVFITGEDKIEE